LTYRKVAVVPAVVTAAMMAAVMRTKAVAAALAVWYTEGVSVACYC
jgi:hypothetical protein